MAKRGQIALERVRYEWDSGIKGSIPSFWLGQTGSTIARLQEYVNHRGGSLRVMIDKRNDDGQWIEAAWAYELHPTAAE